LSFLKALPARNRRAESANRSAPGLTAAELSAKQLPQNEVSHENTQTVPG
jgi:hypothetical protein